MKPNAAYSSLYCLFFDIVSLNGLIYNLIALPTD